MITKKIKRDYSMLWVKAFHIITMVTWFSGLFYLPRLFVYHAAATDAISIERFKIMERRLYYYIMTPGAILTLLFGGWLLSFNAPSYLSQGWMHIKLTLVLLLILYHIYLGSLLAKFAQDHNQHSQRFYRYLNELPSLLLIAIVILVVVKPI